MILFFSPNTFEELENMEFLGGIFRKLLEMLLDLNKASSVVRGSNITLCINKLISHYCRIALFKQVYYICIPREGERRGWYV